MGERLYWIGSNPTNCDLCKTDLLKGKVFIDGKTKQGPWGCMCTACYQEQGFGLGVGRGQKYVLEADGKWYKVEDEPTKIRFWKFQGWVHPPQGDDYEIQGEVTATTEERAKMFVRAHLAKKSSCTDDFTVKEIPRDKGIKK